MTQHSSWSTRDGMIGAATDLNHHGDFKINTVEFEIDFSSELFASLFQIYFYRRHLHHVACSLIIARRPPMWWRMSRVQALIDAVKISQESATPN
jgi:hypothetical protein